MSVNMNLVKQAKQIIIRNIDKSSQSGDKTVVHNTLSMNPMRALIVGPSNCGKTNVMINPSQIQMKALTDCDLESFMYIRNHYIKQNISI